MPLAKKIFPRVTLSTRVIGPPALVYNILKKKIEVLVSVLSSMLKITPIFNVFCCKHYLDITTKVVEIGHIL